MFAIERWVTSTPLLFRYVSTWPARPCEYGSWKSRTTTFFTFSLSTMNFASFGPWMPSSGTTRKNAGVASLVAPFVSDVRVADGEMCASFASK